MAWVGWGWDGMEWVGVVLAEQVGVQRPEQVGEAAARARSRSDEACHLMLLAALHAAVHVPANSYFSRGGCHLRLGCWQQQCLLLNVCRPCCCENTCLAKAGCRMTEAVLPLLPLE